MANELIIPVKYVFDKSDIQTAGNALGALTAQEIKLETEMNDVANAARRQATEFGKAGNAGVKAARDTEKQYNMLGNGMGNLQNMIAGAFAVDRLLAFGKAVVEVGAEFESLRLSIDFASGGAAEGAKNFQFLQEISQRLGLDLMGAAQGFKQIVASSQQAGISNAETRRIFESVATAGRAMGLSVQDTNGIFLALSQVISKGTVQAEELRGQIGERLPGAFNIAARAMGVTTQELNKMLEQGQVLSKDFLPAFATELQKTFEGALPQATESVRANSARMATTWDEALTAMSSRSDGFVFDMQKLAIKFNKGLKNIFSDPVYDAKQEALAKVTDFEASLLTSLKGLANKTKAEGGNVDAAIRGNIINIRAGLIADLKKSQSELTSIEKNIEGRTLVPHTLKTAFIETSARVTLLKGELDALKTLGEKVLKDATGGDEAELGQLQKLRKEREALVKTREEDVNITEKERVSYINRIKWYDDEIEWLTKLNSAKEKRNKAVKLPYLDEIEGYEYASKTKLEILKDEAEAEKDIRDLSTRNLKDYLDEQERLQREYHNQIIEIGVFAGNLYLENRQNQLTHEMERVRERYDHEIAAAGDNLEARKILEKNEADELKKLEEKKAKLARQAASFNILVTAAEKAFAIKAQAAVYASNPLTAPLAALALKQLITLGVFTGLQLTAVNAAKIPGYLKGVRKVPGQYKGKDEVLAMLAPEERVITAEKNRQLSPAFDVLTDSRRSPQFWNKTLLEIEKLGVFTPPKLTQLAAGSANGGIDTDRIVNAVRGIVIERTIFDERGVVRYTEKENNRIRKLNKRYGF